MPSTEANETFGLPQPEVEGSVLGNDLVLECEVIEWDPPRRLVLRGEGEGEGEGGKIETREGRDLAPTSTPLPRQHQ